MSKISNILKMLILLRSRGKMKIMELAEEIEVDERMIRKYKEELEQAGIYISSSQGKYGGYSIDYGASFMNLKLEPHEQAALHMAKEFLTSEEFMFVNEYLSAIDKINCAVKHEEDNNEEKVTFVKSSRPNVDLPSERKKYNDISIAVICRNKIKLKYFSLSSGERIRVVRPYSVFVHNGIGYFIGHCELRNEIRSFKISRILDYEILNEKFEKPKDFNLKESMKNSIGIIYDKEFKIKLKIEYPMSAIVRERIWVENQKIVLNEQDDSIIFEALMTGFYDIKNWIMSMGSSVKVLEPKELRDAIVEEIKKLKNIYQI